MSRDVRLSMRPLDPPDAEEPDFKAAWSEELDRREREMDHGEVAPVDWEGLRASLER